MKAKDYNLIAEGLRVLPMSIRPDVAEHFCDLLGVEDPKFNRNKFLIACGVYRERRVQQGQALDEINQASGTKIK